jgi:hypothetical protein
MEVAALTPLHKYQCESYVITFHREMEPGAVGPGAGCPIWEEDAALIPAPIWLPDAGQVDGAFPVGQVGWHHADATCISLSGLQSTFIRRENEHALHTDSYTTLDSWSLLDETSGVISRKPSSQWASSCNKGVVKLWLVHIKSKEQLPVWHKKLELYHRTSALYFTDFLTACFCTTRKRHIPYGNISGLQ